MNRKSIDTKKIEKEYQSKKAKVWPKYATGREALKIAIERGIEILEAWERKNEQ